MGIGLQDVQYLSERGHLSGRAPQILDIGSQCLHDATPEAIRALASRHPGPSQASDQEIERVAYFSTPRPGERTAYLSELLDLTGIGYHSYDIAPALRTTIFDLNTDQVPVEDRGAFDVVLNCGTSEHVINQWNCFKVMHDAVKIGGVIMHQVPSSGYLDHGYFCYHEGLFRDLAKANRYSVEDLWYSRNGQRLNERPETAGGAPLPNTNLNVVLRKTVDRPFVVALELATAHAGGALDHLANVLYVADRVPTCGDISGRALLAEIGRRVMKRLRLA